MKNKRKSKVIFAGTPLFAKEALLALIEHELFDVIAVLTKADRGVGRGRKVVFSEVKSCALAHNIPVLQPERLHEAYEKIALLAPDVIVVAAYGKIFPQKLLDLPPLGCINIHASSLPRWRGASPIEHALMHGDKKTGISVMQMDSGLDTGPVFEQEPVLITATENKESLTRKLALLGAKMITKVLERVVTGQLQARSQPTEGVTHAPTLRKEAAYLADTDTALTALRKIQAFAPHPGVSCLYKGQRIKLLAAELIDQDGAFGAIHEVSGKGVDIFCSKGLLRVTKLQLEGKKPTDMRSFFNGHQDFFTHQQKISCLRMVL